MKIDQNQPGPWIGIGIILVVIGAIVSGAAGDQGPAVGRFLMIAGAILAVVGLIMFAVRAGISGGRDQ